MAFQKRFLLFLLLVTSFAAVFLFLIINIISKNNVAIDSNFLAAIDPFEPVNSNTSDFLVNQPVKVEQWHLDRSKCNMVDYACRLHLSYNQISQRNYWIDYIGVRYDVSEGMFWIGAVMNYAENGDTGFPGAYDHHVQDEKAWEFLFTGLVISYAMKNGSKNEFGPQTRCFGVLPRFGGINKAENTAEIGCRWHGAPKKPPHELTMRISFRGEPGDVARLTAPNTHEAITDNDISARWAQVENPDGNGLLDLQEIPDLVQLLPIVMRDDDIITVAYCSKPCFKAIPDDMLVDWIDYHIFVGIEHFTLLDRTFTFKQTLKPYIDSGMVHVIDLPPLGFSVAVSDYIDQTYMMDYCRFDYYYSASWIAFFDFDEYMLFPVDTFAHLATAEQAMHNVSLIDSDVGNDLTESKIFPSSCLSIGAGSLSLNKQLAVTNSFLESLKRYPLSPSIFGSSSMPSMESLLPFFATACRSMLSDALLSVSSRRNMVHDYSLHSLVFPQIMFVDTLQISEESQSTYVSPPHRFGCSTCKSYFNAKDFRRPAGQKHLIRPSHSSCIPWVHWSSNCEQRGGHSSRIPHEDRENLRDLFPYMYDMVFAHYGNMLKERVNPEKRSMPLPFFWSEAFVTMTAVQQWRSGEYSL